MIYTVESANLSCLTRCQCSSFAATNADDSDKPVRCGHRTYDFLGDFFNLAQISIFLI